MMTYISASVLGERIHYNPRYINEYLKDRVFVEGTHYVRLPGSRRILYIWETIEIELLGKRTTKVPMANGGVCHG